MSQPFPVAANEPDRLSALRALDIVGTEAEVHFDAVCRTAAALFGLPIALISMVEEDHQWFKAKCGLTIDRTDRDLAFCNHALLADTVLVVEDARQDHRFADNALVTGQPHIRFYAGAPLVIGEGLRIGTLCVIDVVPRSFSAEQCRQLQDLAAIVVSHLRLHAAGVQQRRENAERGVREAFIAAQTATLRQREESLSEANRLLLMAEQMAQVGHWRIEVPDGRRTWSREMFHIFGLDPTGEVPSPEEAILHYRASDRAHIEDILATAVAQSRDFAFDTQLTRRDGEIRSVVLRGSYEGMRGDRPTFAGVIMDVTELRRAEHRLRQSEGRFRLLVEGITDCAICMLDPDGVVADWHAGGERIYGYRAEEILGRHVSHLFIEKDRAAGVPGATLDAAKVEGRAETSGWRLRKDGTRFWASDLIQPVHDPRGQLIGFAGLTRDVTEQRKAETALQVSEARYRSLTDSSTDMITQLDLEGRRVYVSPASQALLGYASAELIGMSPRDAMHPDDLPAFSALMERVVAGAETRAVSVNRLRHRDGRWIWVEASIHLLKDGLGRPEGFLTSVRDTTDRRRAEEALRESETRYRILADTLPQMVWIMDREHRATIYANPRFERYHGAIGTGFRERMTRYHPDDLAAIESAWNEGIVARGAWEADVRVMRQDGVFRWHKLMIAPIHHGPEIASWLGTALDIHDVLTAKEALLQSGDLLRIATEAAGAGTWDVDLVGNGVVLSPESAAMHGLDGSAPMVFTADDWNDLVYSEDTARVWSEVKRSVEAKETYSAEFRVPLPDGGLRWIQGIGRAYYDAQGQPLRMIGLNFDIDARKRVEFALIEAGHAAETARLEAEKASAAKTDFLAAMSHEIRTPLNSILGYTDLLLDGTHHTADDRAKLNRILGSGRALLTIVNDVLDFSKIEAGRIELEPEAFDLDGLLADTMSMIGGLAQGKPLVLRTAIDPILPERLVGDQNRLRQVLLNLLNNAVKFTHDGEVVLTLKCLQRRDGIVKLWCEVRDTGIGIPEDKRDRLFQRFSQVDGSISRRFGGTGLGLAISKSLVELMGGTIGVDSQSGIGSTFWFTVELAAGEAMPILAQEPAIPEASHRAARILLVEDVVMNREIAKAVLTGAGHHVAIACDGAEAIHAVRQAPYDIILMDVQMPVMDGLEATAHIRALGGRFAEVPILALTANVLAEQVAAFRTAGMSGHVGKPFRKADLLAAVARWMPDDDPEETMAETTTGMIDRERFDEMTELLGGEKLARMLGELERVLATEFVVDPASRSMRAKPEAGFAPVAHKLVSSAGMLGFIALSDACRTFERAHLDGEPTSADLDRVADASLLALETLAALRSELTGPIRDGAALRSTGS